MVHIKIAYKYLPIITQTVWAHLQCVWQQISTQRIDNMQRSVDIINKIAVN